MQCEDIYESLLSRCNEYVSVREETTTTSNSNSSSSNNSSWLVRRIRLDLLWEPDHQDQDIAAYCKVQKNKHKGCNVSRPRSRFLTCFSGLGS